MSGKPQKPPGALVSLAVSQHNRIMAPWFLKASCKTDSREYVKCLEDHHAVQLGSYPALKHKGLLVEDNAPARDSRFTNAWKDKRWPIHDVRWPPNSADLNPLDYSIWTQIEGRLQPSYPSKAALKAGAPGGAPFPPPLPPP